MDKNSISILVNGEPRQVAGEITLGELMRELKLQAPYTAASINGAIVPRSEQTATRLHANDQVVIVHAVGGG
jgi:sulfur carrier protein